MFEIQVNKLRSSAIVPTYGSAGAAGADLYACIDSPICCAPGKTVFIPTGISLAIPYGYAGLIYARSGMACKRGVAPANKVGVIDSDYRGEIMVALHNHGEIEQTILPGDRVAQLVVTPIIMPGFVEVDGLDQTDRGANGFGSTGK